MIAPCDACSRRSRSAHALVAAPAAAAGQANLVLVEVRVDPPDPPHRRRPGPDPGRRRPRRAIAVRVRRAGRRTNGATGRRCSASGPRPSASRCRSSSPAASSTSRPGTTYEIELHAVDPDGLDETRTVRRRPRPVPPAEPAQPRAVAVSDAAQLRPRWRPPQPGDVITLADGTYAGPFTHQRQRHRDDPIVIRGGAGAVLDGGGCDGCNVLEVYGSYVHVERLDHPQRASARCASRAPARPATSRGGCSSTTSCTASARAPDQTDFTICDNEIDGRLAWPWTFDRRRDLHWDDRGIDVNGDGHVVCHNHIARLRRSRSSTSTAASRLRLLRQRHPRLRSTAPSSTRAKATSGCSATAGRTCSRRSASSRSTAVRSTCCATCSSTCRRADQAQVARRHRGAERRAHLPQHVRQPASSR